MNQKQRQEALLLLLLLLGASSPTSATLPGFGDPALYQNASAALVGAQAFLSFSSASAQGPRGFNVTGHSAPGPEALCNCACFALDDFAYCQNTAKTTVGVSTFAYSPFSERWEGKALRYFAAGTPGDAAGRIGNSFLESAVLPDGPGGAIYLEVAYVGDVDNDAARCETEVCRSAELIRGHTTPVSCTYHTLCDAQCAGVAQYEAWRKGCGRANAPATGGGGSGGGGGGGGGASGGGGDDDSTNVAGAGVAVAGGVALTAVISYFGTVMMGQRRSANRPPPPPPHVPVDDDVELIAHKDAG